MRLCAETSTWGAVCLYSSFDDDEDICLQAFDDKSLYFSITQTNNKQEHSKSVWGNINSLIIAFKYINNPLTLYFHSVVAEQTTEYFFRR